MDNLVVFLVIIGIVANAIKQMRGVTKPAPLAPINSMVETKSPVISKPPSAPMQLSNIDPLNPVQGGQPRFSAPQNVSIKARQQNAIQARLAQVKSPATDSSKSTSDLARLRAESDTEYARDRLKLRQENEAEMEVDALLRGDFSQENEGRGRVAGSTSANGGFNSLQRNQPLINAIILSQVFIPRRSSMHRTHKQSN